MSSIDLGDLHLNTNAETLHQGLFDAIRDKIIYRRWQKGSQLPSTRKAAHELKISRNTVVSAYEQLAAEGYISSRQGAGYFVSLTLPDHFLSTVTQVKEPLHTANSHLASLARLNRPFTPGIPDLKQFPYAKWQKILQRNLSREAISGIGELQGDSDLRQALSQYLTSSRSVSCTPERIIITSGAQQALAIALHATLDKNDTLLMEEPGYSQMNKVVSEFGIVAKPLMVEPFSGIDLAQLNSTDASAIYLTPSNQYPMGSSLNMEQRLTVLDWANSQNSWIIEDDYDSEFQYAHRPYPSLQGLSAQTGYSDRTLYIGSFSKTMFNGLRMGYMVVPEALLNSCLSFKAAIGGHTPSHTQSALAEFISEGHFLSHLRKMRNLYQKKHEVLCRAISTQFNSELEVISQPAGLHITVRWYGLPSELTLSDAMADRGITVRPLSYYEKHGGQRGWNGLVLGYGNVPIEQIDPLISELHVVYLQLRN